MSGSAAKDQLAHARMPVRAHHKQVRIEVREPRQNLVADADVIAVDAPLTLGHNITRAIRTVTKAEVEHAIYSHSHADHAGAMALYEPATMYAQADAARLLERDNDPNRPVPTEIFTDSRRIEVGGEILQLDYHGSNHSPGNLFIYAPNSRH